MKYKDLYKENQFEEGEFPIRLKKIDSTSSEYVINSHWHEEFEILRVLSGELSLFVNNDLYKLKTGDIAFVNCTNVHRTEPKNCKYEYIDIDLQIMRTKLGSIYQKYFMPMQSCKLSAIPVLPSGKSATSAAINNLFTILSEKKDFYELNLLSSLYGIFELMFKNNYICETTVSRKEIKQSAVVSNLMHWIEDKYTDTITLTILAEKAQLNKNYICKIFKESTGKTPIEYVNEIRIKNVCKELETGKKSIAQIASDNGYKDMSYFCKVFKKHTGITAKKYISQLGMDIE